MIQPRAALLPLLFGAGVLALWPAVCAGPAVPGMLPPPPSGIARARATRRHLLGVAFLQTVLRSVLPGRPIGRGAGLLAAIALDRSDFMRRGAPPLGGPIGAMPIVGVAPSMVMRSGAGVLPPVGAQSTAGRFVRRWGLEPTAYQRTLDEPMGGGSDPVHAKPPRGAWMRAVFETAFGGQGGRSP